MRDLTKKATPPAPTNSKPTPARISSPRPTLQLLQFSRQQDLAKKSSRGASAAKPSRPVSGNTGTRPATQKKISKQAAAKAALESVKIAQPRATFSLSALFESIGQQFEPPQLKSAVPSSQVSRSPVTRKGPKGVPSIGRWKQNRDGSITGYIFDSPSFKDNEKITTSPIGRGIIAAGSVVTTKSGSQYFLQ